MNKKTFLLAGAVAAFALFAAALPAADTKDYPGTALEPSGNPIFTDAWTCDPAPLVVGDRLFVYTGEDIYKDGEQNGLPGNYNIAAWRCYSTTDMVHWTSHGVLLKPEQFPNGRAGVAWAAQVVEKGGKFYWYVTYGNKNGQGNSIGVAIADSPIGPFKPVEKPVITDDMTSGNDIDPTVLIDDDGTAWLAWGQTSYLAKLKDNMCEIDGEIINLGLQSYIEGPWLYKRKGLYYNIYAGFGGMGGFGGFGGGNRPAGAGGPGAGGNRPAGAGGNRPAGAGGPGAGGNRPAGSGGPGAGGNRPAGAGGPGAGGAPAGGMGGFGGFGGGMGMGGFGGGAPGAGAAPAGGAPAGGAPAGGMGGFGGFGGGMGMGGFGGGAPGAGAAPAGAPGAGGAPGNLPAGANGAAPAGGAPAGGMGGFGGFGGGMGMGGFGGGAPGAGGAPAGGFGGFGGGMGMGGFGGGAPGAGAAPAGGPGAGGNRPAGAGGPGAGGNRPAGAGGPGAGGNRPNRPAGGGGGFGECINYSTAEKITGPWTFRGQVTGSAENSFTIHPGVVDFKGHTYLFYHNGKLDRDGQTGQSLRRSVCVDELFFNEDGTIKEVVQTKDAIKEPLK